jgi:hypothetical protein
MNVTIPARLQLRIELQALCNALRRATSDRLKLLRLAGSALATAEAGAGDAAVRARLREVRDTLARDLPLDRARTAADLQRFSSAYAHAPARPRTPTMQ